MGAIVYVDHFQEGNVYEVNNLYETSFPKLTDQYFKVRTTIKESDYLLTWQNHFQASPWPEAEDVAPYVNDDPIFLNLYRCYSLVLKFLYLK